MSEEEVPVPCAQGEAVCSVTHGDPLLVRPQPVSERYYSRGGYLVGLVARLMLMMKSRAIRVV
jgi:hypothetical protein